MGNIYNLATRLVVNIRQTRTKIIIISTTYTTNKTNTANTTVTKFEQDKEMVMTLNTEQGKKGKRLVAFPMIKRHQ